MPDGVVNNGGGMPQPRLAPTLERLSPSLSEDALFARFMREFGDTSRAEFLDLAGNPLIVDRNLFLNRKNEWKIMKGERAPWLLYTAINIKEPDEIWLEPGRRGGADKLYFFSRFDVERRGFLACLAVFEREQGALGM